MKFIINRKLETLSLKELEIKKKRLWWWHHMRKQVWNQNQGDSHFDAVDYLPRVLATTLHLLVSGIGRSNGDTVDFIFPKMGNNGWKLKLECFILFWWTNHILFSICNGYYVCGFHFCLYSLSSFPFSF